ncbi:L,D-transpeptidase family protein [Rubrivirga sp. S365]|uniref:L,D-transpeptidase family protein n=1 Tax=Rubrivirga litoralis TaxID=3075598 RepID=A0ABU3BRH9_9BACT|nr:MULTISPECIES: L,D-transpeptidase family protein [unclassified Rubrivirga]MDT0631897.1 L,D-transpeptidase family protein [Rubrivirga sp. F394]MDT7857950.1 L,D-transpeptidase family protein [Rubrivirga sp. S365]
MPPVSPLLAVALAALLGWGPFSDWFGADDEAAAPPAAEAVDALAAAHASAQTIRVGGAAAALRPETRAAYAGGAALWALPAERRTLRRAIGEAAADGLRPAEVHAPTLDLLDARLAEAEAQWEALDGAARDTLADPRPALVAALDVLLTDGALRLGGALLGERADPASLYPGVWHATDRDPDGERWAGLQAAVRSGDARRVAAALGGLRPAHAGYRRLRARLDALGDDLAPVPEGTALRPGGRSVRVPHLRERLDALGWLPADSLDAWTRPDAYLLDDSLAAGLARFESAHGLASDSVLDASVTDALNADLDGLRDRLALNLERWRWLPDDFGEHYVWVNLPAFEIRAFMRDSTGGVAESLRMPANIGNAQTTGWTTPVISDSIHTLEFQPAWYVPRSLAAAQVLPMAQRDSLSLHRQGFEVYQNGQAVDSRLVPWDSVSVSSFRFVQRPGPANPLGRVKFLMHNPYAILIHDTNKRYTFDDGSGSSMSSGCVQASAPDELAEHLMTTVNGWEPGRARAAWRGGPRRGVRLERPVRTHFVYFTAWAEEGGALRLYADPYGYDAALAAALGRARPAPDDAS